MNGGGGRERNGNISQAAGQDGCKNRRPFFFFFLGLPKVALGELCSLLACGPALPERILLWHCKTPKRLSGQGGCVWSSLNKFCISGNYHSFGQSTGRVATGIPALQTEKKSVRTILINDSNGSLKHVDDFFHVLMPLATSGIKRGEYQ